MLYIIIYFLILLSIVYILHIYEKNKFKKMPIFTLYGRVLAKRSEQQSYVYGNSTNGSGFVDGGSCPVYYVTFEFSNGERLEIAVPQTTYGTLFPGDTGTLTYKYSNNLYLFQNFVRDK